MSSGCSGDLTLTGSQGVFSDGSGRYRNSLDCQFKLQPSTAHTVVRVVLTELELLDDGDRLEVYDGLSTTSTLLASYTGDTLPASITSTGSAMLVRLRTDSAGETGAGFQASYQAVCIAGYSWDGVSAECRPCPAGSYSAFPAAEACTPCAVGFYAAAEGVSTCSQCPAYATTAYSGSYLLQACACQPGYYGWDNACRVCPEGATCPGGNLVAARAGWCANAPSLDANFSAAAPSFSHCCQPDMCPGGLNAQCDASIGVVGGASCAVQTISWDTLHLVSLTNGTWITFLLILTLALIICFCTGLSIGVRRAVRRQLDSLVVPVPSDRSPRSPSLSTTRARAARSTFSQRCSLGATQRTRARRRVPRRRTCWWSTSRTPRSVLTRRRLS